MVNHTTGSQRYNARMDKIWEDARKLGALDEPKKKIECVKIKNGNITKIPKGVCDSKKKIDKLLDDGFTVSKKTEWKAWGGSNQTKIESFSPRKREPENKWIQEAFKSGKVVEDFEEDEEITGPRKQNMIDKNAYLRGDY